jgi:hypothetical protein
MYSLFIEKTARSQFAWLDPAQFLSADFNESMSRTQGQAASQQ